jgi:hypothetical protein
MSEIWMDWLLAFCVGYVLGLSAGALVLSQFFMA